MTTKQQNMFLFFCYYAVVVYASVLRMGSDPNAGKDGTDKDIMLTLIHELATSVKEAGPHGIHDVAVRRIVDDMRR